MRWLCTDGERQLASWHETDGNYGHLAHTCIEAVGCATLFEPASACEFVARVGGTANY